MLAIMFWGASMIFIKGLLQLGKGQIEDQACYTSLRYKTVSEGKLVGVTCDSDKVVHILCATLIDGLANHTVEVSKSDILHPRCTLRPKCYFQMDSGTLSFAHTPNQSKALNVAYECKTLLVVAIDESAQKTISCQGNSTLRVYSGIYTSSKKPCGMEHWTIDLRKKCNGKTECTISVANVTYDDPCPGKPKTLTVDYGCHKDCPSIECSEPCNENCQEKNCFQETLGCDLSCSFGFQSDQCVAKCPDGFYGSNCTQSCNSMCGGLNNVCDRHSGACLYDCDPGYIGEMCAQMCPPKTYGLNCSQQCSQFCAGLEQHCYHVDGTCTDGCLRGFSGPTCSIESPHSVRYSPKAILYAIIFAVVVFCFFMIPREARKSFGLSITTEGESGHKKVEQTPNFSI